MPSTRNHERRANKGRAEDLSPTPLTPVCTRKYGRRAARLAAAAASPLALNDLASSMEDIPSPATMERASPRNATLSFPRVEDIADKYPKRLIQLRRSAQTPCRKFASLFSSLPTYGGGLPPNSSVTTLRLNIPSTVFFVVMYKLSHNEALQWALYCSSLANPGPLHVTFVIQVVASNNEWLKTNHVLGPNEELSGTNSDRPLDPDEIMDDINDIMAVDEDDSKRATEEEDKMDVDVALVVNAGYLAPMDLLVEHFLTVMCPGSWMDDI
ncbi:hypothetical protein F5879DRAFT_990285 [Lentinula edodes]|nr:hypothetical protein F5879DRAFT_990285 [Lentinula edodes]KAJ3918652.1 hypothetical protein F5877DRAFT_78802 [Lentinula edodes]